MQPNELAQAIAWMQDCGRLETLLSGSFPRPDRWQVHYVRSSQEPDIDSPAGFAPLGCWEPFSSTDGGYDWRRPLRRVQPDEVNDAR